MMVPWWWRVLAVLVVAAVVTGQDERVKSVFQKRVEQHLLNSFGLEERPPKAVGKVSGTPPYMLELFQKLQQEVEQQEEQQEDHFPLDSVIIPAPNTIRSFFHKETKGDDYYRSHRMRLRYNVTAVPNSEDLRSAELRLTHLKHAEAPDKPEEDDEEASTTTKGKRRKRRKADLAPYLKRLMVYDVLRLATKKTEPALRLLDTRVIDVRSHGVQSLDVSEAVRRWVQQPKSNNGLLVEVVPFNKKFKSLDASHVRLRRAVDETEEDYQPLLVVHSHDGKTSRTRRSTDKHRKTRQSCRRHSLHVDFRKVGWDDWIVAPTGYDAYYCKGDCPFPLPDMLNATNHAVVQTLVNSRYPDRVPKACCVPTELSPISMLYMDDDEKFVLKNHQNMVVEGCGCR